MADPSESFRNISVERVPLITVYSVVREYRKITINLNGPSNGRVYMWCCCGRTGHAVQAKDQAYEAFQGHVSRRAAIAYSHQVQHAITDRHSLKQKYRPWLKVYH